MAEPSIAMIPSGYKAEKIYSVLPTNGNADLDFSRNSKATRINEQGLIEEMAVNVPLLDYSDGTCPSLKLQPQSTNLITYSEAFGNSYWTKSGASIQGDASTAGVEKVVNGDFETDITGWLSTGSSTASWDASGAAIIDITGAGGGLIKNQTLSLNASSTYKLSVDVKAGTFVGNINIIFDGINVSLEALTSSYQTFIVYVNSASSDPVISFTRATASTGTIYIDNVSVKEVQGFSVPSVDSPLGAFKLVTDNVASQSYIKRNITVIATNVYTYSVLAKKGEVDFIALVGLNSLTTSYFDLSNGTALGSTATSSSIEDYGNGWYRCSTTFTADTTTKFCGVYLSSNGTSLNATSIPNGDGVYIFGAQLEQQSYATSYIKTEGSTQTRLQDTASKSGISSLINSEEGTLFVEMSALTSTPNGEKTISLSDGTDSNRVSIYKNSSSENYYTFRVYRSGFSIVATDYLLSDITDSNELAISYGDSLSDNGVYVNGVRVADWSSYDTSFVSGTLNKLSFDNGAGNYNLEADVQQLQVFKIALTDAQLTTLTTI